MKFQVGDKAKVIKNENEGFLKHFIEIGKEVEIAGVFNGWKGHEAYNVKGYSEPLLAEELDKLTI